MGAKETKQIDSLIKKWEFKHNNYKRIQEAKTAVRAKVPNDSIAHVNLTIEIQSARTAKLLCQSAIEELTELRKNV